MRLKKLFLAASAALLLITSQQALADDDDDDQSYVSSRSSSPFWDMHQLVHAQREYWVAVMYLYDLQRAWDIAKAQGGDAKAAEKAFRKFERGIFKRIEKAYKRSRPGRIIWLPVPGWNPWMPPGWLPEPGQGGGQGGGQPWAECYGDPGPCLQCENGLIVPDDNDSPNMFCYQCSGGVAVPANGSPCNDYDPCTTNDVCSQGRCGGTPVNTVSPNNPQCR